MSEAERDRVVDMLPARVPFGLMPPEGDSHRKAKNDAMDALDGFFRRAGRRIYLSSELAVYYPNEPRFAPDLLAVLDVEPHDRMTWVVAKEGKGLDFVLEVHVAGDWSKDHTSNVERYARLGIREYFIFDRGRFRLEAYRLGLGGYQRIVPQAGRFISEVLGLDLALHESKLRFFAGNAALEDAGERIARLGSMLDEVVSHKEDAERRAEAAEAALAEERSLRAEVERRLAEAEAELAALKPR